jgi:hypothetical protein
VNFIKFHQLAARLLEAPTEKIMRLIQESIAVWMLSVGEKRAAVWWRTYHMGDLGNVANASAGYCGTNMASGIESCWKYIRRDTVGTAGSNMSMSLEVFAPSLVKHMSDMSERHACKMLDATTGTHMFRSLPLIKPAVWKSVQKFNVQRLQLSWVENDAGTRFQWEHITDLLCAPDDADKMSFTDLVKKFHDDGHKVDIARTNITCIIIPTVEFVASLVRMNIYDTYEKLEAAVRPVQAKYDMLFNDTDNFLENNPGADVEQILGIMESHHRGV